MSVMMDIRNLSKIFRSGNQIVEAVRGINLQVPTASIFGFIGPNGAGKTTTLRMLATLLQPSGGQAMIAGCDLINDPFGVREHIGYVGQVGGCDAHVTGRENLVLQGRLYGLSKVDAQARAQNLVKALKLESFCDRSTKTLSGGQRRRVDIAMGMIHQPKLLFLDEPTTGLDPQSRAYLWNELRGLQNTGLTIFMTTHYLDEADALCDRVAIIDHGRIVAEGSPSELKKEIAGDIITLGVGNDKDTIQNAQELLSTQPFIRDTKQIDGLLHLYVDSGEEAIEKIINLMSDRGIVIRSLSLERPSLDEVFLRKTGHALRDDNQNL